MSIAQKAGQAGTLMLFRKGWGVLVSFGVMAYLARVLDKSDFGLLAISNTLIGFIQTFAVSGISDYVVYYTGKDEKEVVNSAFWFNLLMTTVVCVVVLLAAPFWASFYKDERINNIIYLLLISFFFNMLSSIAIGQFRKNLDFKPMVMIQTTFNTISQLSQIALAFLGFGVYSLALPNAVISPIMAIILIYKSGFRLKLTMNREHWGSIFGYTKHVIGATVLSKFVNEGDTLIIGKFLGMKTLGIYNLAFQFAHLFFSSFLPIITSITLPIYAKIKEDKEKLGETFIRSLRLIAFVTVPVIFFQILFSKQLINLVYGPTWQDAVIPFQILSLFVLFKSVANPSSGLYNATGNPQIGFYFVLIFAPIFIGAVLFSSIFKSLIITTIIVSFVRILGTLTHFFLSGKLINKTGFGLMKKALKSSIPALILALPILSVRLITHNNIVYIEMIVFIVGYFYLFIKLLNKEWQGIYNDIRSLLPVRLRNSFPIDFLFDDN